MCSVLYRMEAWKHGRIFHLGFRKFLKRKQNVWFAFIFLFIGECMIFVLEYIYLFWFCLRNIFVSSGGFFKNSFKKRLIPPLLRKQLFYLLVSVCWFYLNLFICFDFAWEIYFIFDLTFVDTWLRNKNNCHVWFEVYLITMFDLKYI